MASPPPPPPVLDVRSPPLQRWIRRSTRIPHHELLRRSAELPPRTTAVTLLYDSGDAASAGVVAWLQQRLVVADADAAAGDACWAALAARGHAVEVLEAPSDPGCEAAPSALLWQASPALPAAAAAMLRAWGGAGGACARRWVLDAGAGSGRNAVALARALATVPVRIAAVDNRASLTARCRDFAARHGCGEAVVPVLARVEALWLSPSEGGGDGSDGDAPPKRFADFDAALFMRFTHKPALTALGEALHALHSISGGGCSSDGDGGGCSPAPFFLLVEGFHVSCAHPEKEAQKLREGEVLALVSAPERGIDDKLSRWKVLFEKVRAIEDGRPSVTVLLQFDRRCAGGALQ